MWQRLLPALIPSWRFFDVIGPAPRCEYRLLSAPARPIDSWREFRPRPAHLSPLQVIGHLFWSPAWNETLFVMRCAERVLEGDTGFPLAELERRLRAHLVARGLIADAPLFEMRILACRRSGTHEAQREAYRSPPLRIDHHDV
jgi:hypothetical protein